MNEDSEGDLLRRYVSEGDEAAFTELVRSKVNLVHSAALRQVYGDAQLAEEITQSVFLDLARKAGSLTRHTALSGWLYTSTRFAATKALRAQQRWQTRTQGDPVMHDMPLDPSHALAWLQIRAVLDSAMEDLGARDREAVLLRFFEGCPLAEVGRKVGLSENSARMRVDRALDKLRVALIRRGITSSAAVLTFLLFKQAVVAAPSGLADTVAVSALKGAAATGGGIAAGGAAKLLTSKLVLCGLAGAAGLGVVAVRLGPGALQWLRRSTPGASAPGVVIAPTSPAPPIAPARGSTLSVSAPPALAVPRGGRGGGARGVPTPAAGGPRPAGSLIPVQVGGGPRGSGAAPAQPVPANSGTLP